MSKMVQICDVPDHIHRVWKARAPREGMSLSDFTKRELKRSAELPSMQEWLDRIQHFNPVKSKLSSAQIIRELGMPGDCLDACAVVESFLLMVRHLIRHTDIALG